MLQILVDSMQDRSGFRIIVYPQIKADNRKIWEQALSKMNPDLIVLREKQPEVEYFLKESRVPALVLSETGALSFVEKGGKLYLSGYLTGYLKTV